MSRPRKNKKFIDPRYFMDEKMEALMEDIEVTEKACNQARAALDAGPYEAQASMEFEEKYGIAPHPYYQKCP